jgi:protein-S-isoprenylcysteine O-methyltransferase Ste14
MGLFGLIFGLGAYFYAFYVLVLYFPLFCGNLQTPMPTKLVDLPSNIKPFFDRSVDYSKESINTDLNAVLVMNAVHWAIFVLQHVIMSRAAFKKFVTQFIPTYCERSLFVLGAALSLHNFILHWQPIPTVLWKAEGTVADVLQGVQLLAWGCLVLSSFMIDHFDLFGVRQVVMAEKYTPVAFQESYFYKYVRHPLMASFIVAFLSQPIMTTGHLYMCALAIGYIFIGVSMEENDLLANVPQYRDYMNRVPGLCPFLPPSKAPPAAHEKGKKGK